MPSQSMGSEGLPEPVPDALVGVDSLGVIRFVNQQTKLLFGYEPDDLVGAPLESLVPNSVQEVHSAHQEGYHSAARAQREGTDLRSAGRRRDGSEFPVKIAFSPMDTENGLLVIASVRDLTYHESADELRRRLDQLSAVVDFSGEAIISNTL
ncbi:MAG: hypothetical protein QOE58_2392, partial [Actinomycetota bacterium]|nr:hypothetical protein [Actinomycetota bacterium]